MCLLFCINYKSENMPITSKLWRTFAYAVGAYIVLIIASLGIGLDTLPYFETEEAKSLRKYNISNLICWATIIALLNFENAYPKDR